MKAITHTAKHVLVYVRLDMDGKRVYWSEVEDFEWHTGEVDIETVKTILKSEQEALQADALLNPEKPNAA